MSTRQFADDVRNGMNRWRTTLDGDERWDGLRTAPRYPGGFKVELFCSVNSVISVVQPEG